MFFKKYTNEYTKNGVELSENQIRTVLSRQWEHILSKEYVNWNEPWVRQTGDQLFESVFEDVKKNMEIFDFWIRAQSEV